MPSDLRRFLPLAVFLTCLAEMVFLPTRFFFVNAISILLSKRLRIHLARMPGLAYEHWGSLEKCAEIANGRQHDTLTDLRTGLFFEQRRRRHFGEQPDEESAAYWRILIAAIRHKLSTDERS